MTWEISRFPVVAGEIKARRWVIHGESKASSMRTRSNRGEGDWYTSGADSLYASSPSIKSSLRSGTQRIKVLATTQSTEY